MSSKDQNITNAHARYLGAELIAIANVVATAGVTRPVPGALPEADESEMMFFVDLLRLILPVLGLDFLRQHSATARTTTEATVKPGQGDVAARFRLTSNKHGVEARAQEIDCEFVVLAQSHAVKDWSETSDQSYSRRCAQLIKSGKLVPGDNGRLRFAESVAFWSPSAASAVILGRPDNGRVSWKERGSNDSYRDLQSEQVVHRWHLDRLPGKTTSSEMSHLTESQIEEAALEWLAGLGYAVLYGPDISPDGSMPERGSYDQVLLTIRHREALARLNPHLPAEMLEEVLRKVQQTETPSLIEENRRLHRYLIEGVPVEVAREDGSIGGDVARLIDFVDVDANDWLAVNQYTVIEGQKNRRPDVVLFVNGLPLAVIELKNPGDENATLDGAFNQLQTYKDQIPSLFRTNAMLVTSDGLHAHLGSLTANLERFMPWRTVDGSAVAPKGAPELGTVIEGVFEKARFLTLIRDFTVFADTGSGLVKIVAGYHQFHAVRHAVKSTIAAASPKGDRRIGVIWHTQGSGKSLLMAFYAGQIIAHPAMENPTFVVITDRNDLDDQLFGTFAMCRDLLRQTPRQADSREDLQKALTRPAGGVVFTTIQKFAPERGETDYPVLTDRRNVVVIADEAHRSQYGFRARVNPKTGEIAHGFAKYLRDALPNASFIGFTGTPIEQEDVNTPAVFGEYIDVYDINRGVEDGATVPIYYESRLARIELDEDEKPKLDDEVAELTEDDAQSEQEKLKRRWAKVEAVVGAEKRLAMVAKDLVEHFENRVVGMDGKAMIVCMSRRICVALYDQIIKLRPAWHSEDDESGVLKIVMTGAASEPEGVATACRRQGAPGAARQAGQGPRGSGSSW